MSSDSNKRLIYVTASFPFGPGESFIRAELFSWKKLGYHITVIPIWPRGQKQTLPESAALEFYGFPLFAPMYLLSVLAWLVKRPFEFFSLLTALANSPIKLHKNLPAFIKGCAMARELQGNTGKHIHAHWGGPSSTMAMVMSRLLGVPWSMTCHRWDIYEDNLLAAKSRSALFTRFISRRGMDDALKLGVERIRASVIPMGVEQVFAATPRTLSERIPVIMCAANLIEVKGHRYLLEAVARLKERGIQIALKLAGQGPLQPKLVVLAEELGVASQIDFLGQLDQNRLFSLYAEGAVDLFVLPSVHLGDGEHEGVPVSLMEAMCHGIPVISTKTGSIEELLEPELGLTVPDKNSEALAIAIADLVTQPNRYHLISQQVMDIIRRGWLIPVAVRAMEVRMGGASPPASE